jgi:succinylarginine dihydrolase
MSGEKMQNRLAHTVFFTLNDTSSQARAKLIAACHEYLSGHDGVLHFAVGTIASELHRAVNVRDFDIALHIIFEHLAAHDHYQVHPRHLRFIEENRSNWKQVRVFDSTLL